MRCRVARIASTKPLIFLIFVLASLVQGETWYIGCVEDQLTLEAPQGPLPPSEETVFSPATCCSSCLQAGFQFAGMQGESLCKCTNSSSLPVLTEDHCNYYCSSGSIQLPCGGEDTYSVYSVKGPYLHTLELDKTQSLIQQDTSVLFEAKTYLAREPVEDDGIPNLSDTNSLDEVDFVWFVDKAEWGATTRPSSNETIQASLFHTFIEEGEWTIGVQVKNPVSSLSAFTNVTVVRPLPSDLQVTLHPSQGDIPSCIPAHDGVPSGSSAAAVFVREEVLFQASLAMGINLTFQWSFSDDGSNSSRAPYMQPSCEGIACLRDSQVHTFVSEGTFSIAVNVSNALGSVENILKVVVMNRDITDLNMSLADPTSPIRKLNSTVDFLITMETTARSELLLEIDFGDGSVYNHSLRDVNDTFILGGEQNVAHLHLTASYGEGCELFVSLDHIYREPGVFSPTVSVYSVKFSNISARASLLQTLVIQRTLTDVIIESQESYSTNESAILKIITMPVATENVSCAWNIYYGNVTLQRNTACEFIYTFAQAGKYVFEVTVQNLISQVTDERTIIVQDVVSGLQLESQVDTLIQTGSDVSLLAYVTEGTDVHFRWDFSDSPNNLTKVARLESNNMYPAASVVNHTYTVSGWYNVSVVAFNLLSSSQVQLPDGFVVQDAIQGLILPPMTSTMLHNATVIQAQVGGGSHVSFYLDYGDGLVSPHVELIQDGLYMLYHMFPVTGSYDVNVVAYNAVSSENGTTCVVIEDGIGEISVSAYYPQEDYVILVAIEDGAVVNRTDVKYTWEVSGTIHVSATPLLKISNVTTDVLQILLKAENHVAVQELEVDIVAVKDVDTDVELPVNDVQIKHPVYAEVGQDIQFSIQFTAEKPWNLTVDYGDPSSQQLSTETTSSTFNWTHSYSKPGVYIVALTLASDEENMQVSSALSVQEPLTSVALSGPVISTFSWPISYQVWEVIPQTGTDILYSWSVTMVTDADSTSGREVMTSIQSAGYHSKVPLSFNSAGEYNVTVIASNAISTSTSVSVSTTLQEPILNVVLNIEPVRIGQASTLLITVEGGSSLQFDISFGDESTLHTPLHEKALSHSEITVTWLTPTLAEYHVPKTYAALGEYHCAVRVFNLVSETTVSAVAQVEEGISGLRLTSESSHIIRTGEAVTVIATTDSGNDIVFDWHFDGFGNPHVENSNNQSIATYSFQNPGNFLVQVSVSNHIQHEPIVAYYSEPFIVQEPIIHLDLQVDGNLNGVPLLEIPGGFASNQVIFRASCVGSHVVFFFDYGDGTEEEVDSGSEGIFSEGYGHHVYTQEGNYTITVRAQNYFGNASKMLANTFYVQIPPSFRSACPIRPCNTPLAYESGHTTNLSVQLEGGTQVFYNWSMGDQTNYLFHGPSVSHQYRYVGDFHVTVVAFNKVDMVERRCTVIVQNQIQSVQILVDKELYQLQTSIDFQADTGIDTPHRIQYIWDMGDGRSITKEINTHSYRYNQPQTYFVTVIAKNFVSNATSLPVEIAVQAPIDRLSVILRTAAEGITKSCCSALVGQRIEISTSMYSGSHILFQWDFGDGSDVVTGTDYTVYHSYNRTGEFTVTVFGSNDINNGTASNHVFILQDKLCYPPPINIVGGSQRMVNFSENIRVETTLGVICESTDVVLFEWTVQNANDSVVSLDPLYASLDRRTAFIKRRKLPYGSYTLALKVSMNGTIVYSKDSITVTVNPTPLVAMIDGGTSRVVGNNTDIILNGSKSYDLDQPDNANLRFTWSCYQLETPSNPCFMNGSGSNLFNAFDSSLIFPANVLRLNETAQFVFVLQVDKEDRDPVRTSQVLYVHSDNPVRVLVECTSCVDGIVNRNDALTLNAVCNECSDDTSYTWKLWKINDGSVARDYDYQCELAGGAVFNPEPLPSATTHSPQTNATNEIDEGVGEGQDSFYNGIDTGPLPDPQDSIVEEPETSFVEEFPQETSFYEEVPQENSFEEYIPEGSIVEAPDTEEPDNGAQTSIFEEISIIEETPGGTGEASIPEQDMGGNATIVEDIETTTIIYEIVETTPQGGIVEEASQVDYNEASLVEDPFLPSFEEAIPEDSIVEDIQQDSFVEDLPGGSIQTSHVEDTAQTDAVDNNTAVVQPEATNQPQEDTTDDGVEEHPDITDTTSYVYEEYVYEYFEDIGGLPTASYNTGGSGPGGSITEYVPGGTSVAYEEASIVEGSITGEGSITEGDPYDEYTEDIGSPGVDTSIAEAGSYDYVEDIGSSDVPPNPPDLGGDSDEDSADDGDGVYEPDTPQPGDHIVDKSRGELVFRDQVEYQTGELGKSVSIRKDLLEEGLTYAVEVTADSHGGKGEGEAMQFLFVNDAPHYGHCRITPNEGNELDQIFQANCNEWVDDSSSPLWMELSFRLNESDPQTVLYYGMNQEIHFQLPAGYVETDRHVYVNIAIEDDRGGRASVCSVQLTVTPKVFAAGESKEEFLYNATNPSGSKLLEYIHNGDHNKVYINVITIANALNRLTRLTSEDLTHTLTHTNHHVMTTDDHHAESEVHLLELRRTIRRVLLGASGYLPMRDEREIVQRTLALAQSSAIPVELSHEAISVAVEVLDSCTVSALYCALEENVELSQDMVTSIASTASNMIDALSLNHTHHMPDMERKTAIAKTISVLSKILKVQLDIQEKDNTPLYLETSSMKLHGARVTSLSGQQFVNSYTSVILPSNLNEQLMQQNMEAMAGNPQCQDIEVISFLQNPYSWGTGGERITSGATSVELFSCDDNQKLTVEDLDEGDGIVMEFHHTCDHGHDLHCNYTFMTPFMSVHQFNVTELNIHQTFHITLEMAHQGRILPVAVLLRHQYEPTPYEYDVKWVYSESDTQLDIFLKPDWFNGTGVYYIALMDNMFDQEVYRGDVAKERPYTLRMWWGDCLFWQPQTDAWLSAGCSALSTSTYEVTRCQCNHLTTFAVSFHPIVTTAKFVDLAMFRRPLTNAIPYSFVSALIGVYLLLFIYCYLADKHDERKQGLIYLKDNQACDQHYYEITVETGFRTGAGTTARISIVLHGDDGHSETKELVCDDGRPLFERNSRDRFIISVPESLGSIYKVLVWHNNGGISPSWYLSRIAVRDLITGHKWHFICERWFAVEEEDGKIERGIDVLKEGVGFQKAFWAKGAQYFADYYIWSSIFTRPPFSVFTRVQRLTCCLSISMGFLSICALRYYIMRDEDLELGLVDVSGEAVLCGIIVALLAIPINFPIIMLFRRAKPNYEPEKPEIFSGRRFSEITYDSPDFEPHKIQRGDSWDSGTGMMEHTAITLQNLQAWAKQKWKHRHKSSVFPQNKVAPIEMTGPESESTDHCMSDQQSIFDFGSISSFGDFSSQRDITDSGLSSSYNQSMIGYPHVCLPRHKKVTNPKIWLPSTFLYIAWGLCLGIILFSAVITSVLGYGFTQTKAIYWTQSVYFSFLQCIFVTQPAVMAMFTIVKSWRHRKNIHIFDHYDDNVDLVNRRSLHRSRLDLYENDLEKGIAARQRSRYLRFARPPQAKELQKAKERMLKEKNMYTILKDGILYTIVFVCLLWMAYGKDLKDHHPVNTAAINTFVKTPHPFTNVTTVEELWHWLENDMLDTLYWDEWYNGQTVMDDKGTVMNGGVVLIGRASLRQLRVRPETCRIAPEVRHLFEDCHGGYSPQTQSTKSFGPDDIWYYQDKNELHRGNKWGMFGSYEGDGYAMSLNNTRVYAARQLSQLKNKSWIDSQTRLVILEFTLYNAPTHLFTSVALLAEMPGTGAVYPFPKIESVLLYRYEGAYDYFIICCEMVFLLLVAVTAKGEVHKAIRLRTKYFYSTWSWLEMGLLIISLTYFAMYVTRFIFVEEVIHRFHSTYLEEFVDVSSVAYWDQCLRDLIGSMLFLIGVKLLHLWRFNRTVSKFGAVLDGAIREILLFAFYYILLEGAFACFGVLLLGSHLYPMKHAFTALEALSSSTVGNTPSNHHMDVQFPVWWPIYSILHMICVFVLLSSLIKAILCHSYKKMKDYDREEVNAGELFKFFWDHFLAFFGILKFKDSNNMGKNTLPTEFTMAEIEYQVDELLFKMNAMSHEHSMPEKCHGYMDDSDGTHGLGEDTISCASSDMHSFDQARLDERVQKIESNFYSANPELRELLDGVCLIDEDREKQLRSQLEMEIFRQLQMQRQEEAIETNDSGRDTQSVSDNAANDDLTGARPRPLPSVWGEDGSISFPKPLPNLGLLDMQVSALTSPGHFTRSKPAWGMEPHKSISSPDNISQDNMANDDLEEKQIQKMGSALFVRRSPQLSHTEGSGCEQAYQSNHPRLTRRVSSGTNKDRPSSGHQNLVKNYPEGQDNTISIEGFPLPNALESLSSSSDESQKPTPRHKRKDAGDSRRRLRKTRSQGKGKGRGRCGDEKQEEDAAYMNAGYSSDSDESIPIIPMGPIKYLR